MELIESAEFIKQVFISLAITSLTGIITWFWRKSKTFSSLISAILLLIFAVYFYFNFFVPHTLSKTQVKKAVPIIILYAYKESLAENEYIVYRICEDEFSLRRNRKLNADTIFDVLPRQGIELSVELYNSAGRRISVASKYKYDDGLHYQLAHILLPNRLYLLYISTGKEGGNIIFRTY